MPVAKMFAYFDHAAVAPISLPAREAMQRWLDQAAESGDTVWPQWNQQVEQARDAAAGLLGAQRSEIALVTNTTAGISIVAEGFPWQSGDNVVTLDNEFPSNQYPWLNLASRGVECRRVSTDQGVVDIDRLLAACDDKTRLVAISWIGFASGYRIDLTELSERVHKLGAKLLVDAIQGLGVFPLAVHEANIDFLAADGHKWLLGPEGAGIFFVRRDLLDLLRPTCVGWHSVASGSSFDKIELLFRPDAARFEGGSQNMAGMIGLWASLEMLLAAGTQTISERILAYTELACERLRRAGATILSIRDGVHDSGIVGFSWPHGDPLALRKACLEQGVVLSCRSGRLRISPHAYNDEEDLDRLIAALETAGNGRPS
jgi:selenocysteine lyase/cysteine desulfurase